MLVHGWDLAQAIGAPARFAAAAVAQELEFTAARLGDVPATRRPFAAPQPTPPGASPLERLVALLGRSVAAG